MRILGIDPGSNITGWALFDKTGIECDTIEFGRGKMSQGKIKDMSRKIKNFLREMKPEIIFIERTFSKSIYSTQALTIVRALFFLWADCPVYELGTSQWRSLSGAGKSKEDVKKWAIKKFDIPENLEMDCYEAIGIAVAGKNKIERS